MNLLPATFLAACHWLRICSEERSWKFFSSIPVAIVCENLLRTVLTDTPLDWTDQLMTGAWKSTNWSTYSFSQCKWRKFNLALAVAAKNRLSNGALNLAYSAGESSARLALAIEKRTPEAPAAKARFAWLMCDWVR